jgi:hypothetical protein
MFLWITTSTPRMEQAIQYKDKIVNTEIRCIQVWMQNNKKKIVTLFGEEIVVQA